MMAEVVVKATIILGVGLAALPLATRARASVRHLLMAATFGALLGLPLINSTLPRMTIQVPTVVAERAAVLVPSGASTLLVSDNSVETVEDTNRSAVPSLVILLRSLWAAGAALLLVLLAIDLQRLRTLRRGALPWQVQNDLIQSLLVSSGLRRTVDVSLHEGVSAPLTCGLWRPTILLPIDALDWKEADLRRALVHELEHVQRGDWATQLVARVVCAFYWFHPLVWIAWGRLRLEAERACDDAVVQCAQCTEYAEQLVTLARRLSMARALPSLAMANRTDLSARVTALLDATRRRGRVGHATTACVVGISALIGLSVTSVRAITAPQASTTAAKAAVPARDSAVAPRLPELVTPTRDTVVHPVARGNPDRSARQRAYRPLVDRTVKSRKSNGNAESTLSIIDRPVGGSASAVGAISHSAEASGTATHSASASSSSN